MKSWCEKMQGTSGSARDDGFAPHVGLGPQLDPGHVAAPMAAHFSISSSIMSQCLQIATTRQ